LKFSCNVKSVLPALRPLFAYPCLANGVNLDGVKLEVRSLKNIL